MQSVSFSEEQNYRILVKILLSNLLKEKHTSA